MPIANGFLRIDQLDQEYFYDLEVAHCTDCGMVQLVNRVEPTMMFHDNYAFFSSTSQYMVQHFKSFADSILHDFLPHDPFVVEIGSNDGILLRNFAQRGIRHLGVEPSRNVAAVAEASGINTISSFFNEDCAAKIVEGSGQADALLGANVMCHIEDLHSVMAGAKMLLKPGGVLVFEDPYLGDIVEKTSYDQIYDEHVFYFSVASLQNLAAMHDLEIFDVAPQAVHGGSMRYFIGHRGARQPSSRVDEQREREARLGLELPGTFVDLRRRIEASRAHLVSLLRDLRARGKRVAGYGATSKSTTILNYGGIGPDLIEFISDITPTKQGKLSPGVHIPVRPHAEFQARYPDYAVLFAWNHSREILAKEGAFMQSGGRFIVHVPEVQILEPVAA